jgi:hypothetical protein
MKTIKINDILGMLGLISLVGLSACTTKTNEIVRTNTVVEQRYLPADPGAVEFVWEPPMVNVVDVPPGLDPEGTYYRPAHQAVVEIKQGRWQYYRPTK